MYTNARWHLPPRAFRFGDHSCQHRTLREQNRRKSVDYFSQKTDSACTIGMRRHQAQIQSGHAPLQPKPNEKPHVPAEEDKLGDRNADESVPSSPATSDGGSFLGANPHQLAVPRATSFSQAQWPTVKAKTNRVSSTVTELRRWCDQESSAKQFLTLHSKEQKFCIT